eukprot:Skav226281  [mRNA]  locus=scaffold3301:82160:82864:+ [translate_table: standard]
MARWEHEVHSPNGHFWSLPVLLRAAARGKPSGCEDEVNTDNEEELLERGKVASTASTRGNSVKASNLNTDNEQDLLWRPKERQPASFQSRPSESLGELVDFAEGLRDESHIVVGRSHDRLGSVRCSGASNHSASEASREASREQSLDDLPEESAPGSLQSPGEEWQVDARGFSQQVLAASVSNAVGAEKETVAEWVDEPVQVPFSSVEQTETPVVSPGEANRCNSEVQVCLEAW